MTDLPRLQIAIDPELEQSYGPEIHWTWRQLLTGIGWTWEQVPLTDPCDLAYVSEPASAPAARLTICANPSAWAHPASHHLMSIARSNQLSYLNFNGSGKVSPLARVSEGRFICQHDLIFDTFWLATGQEEIHWPKDRHGFFNLAGTAMDREQVLRQAIASQIGLWLENTLVKLGRPEPIPRWPHHKRAAACAGHDVDYPEIIRWLEPLRIIGRQGRQGISPAWEVLTGRRHHWQFAAWVEMEKNLRTHSAFYFVARQGSLLEYATGTPDSFYDVTSKQFRQLFRYLIEEGFEIGLQASYKAYQSRDKFAAEKQKLEEACGQPITGNRHHYWHLNPKDVEETLLIHEQIGLKYDSSLIHERYTGWRRGLTQPFYPFHQVQRRELKTLQIPTVWMDNQLFGMQAHNPGDRCEIVRRLADQTAEQRGCLVTDVHEYVLDDALYPGWAHTYRCLWEYLLERGDFWIATPAQVAEHWTARYSDLVRASCGLGQGTT